MATLTVIGLLGASVVGSGATVAALYTFQAPKADTNSRTAYLVDVLFRPEIGATETPPANPTASDGAQNLLARSEAERILATALSLPEPMQSADQDRLAVLAGNGAGISTEHARARIVALEADVRAKAAATAEFARRVARDASLWLAASMLFGALVAMLSAVVARIEDDRESIVGKFSGQVTQPNG